MGKATKIDNATKMRRKRYSFVRSKDDPFSGLPDYARANTIDVHNSSINYPIQLALKGLETFPLDYGLKVKLGYYFEMLSQGIYGGITREPRRLNGNSENNLRSEPDITHLSTSCIREIKGVSSGESLKLNNYQILKYVHLQLGNYYLQTPSIQFEIFRHGLDGLIKKFRGKPLESLVDSLSENTKFMLSLPFSVIIKIHQGEIPFTSKYDGEKWDNLTRFLSLGLNSMIAKPYSTLNELGLDRRDFEVEKRRFPEGIKMNKKEIRPFPILVVKDRNFSAWLENFRNNEGKGYLERFEKEMCGERDKSQDLFEAGGGMSLETDEGDISFDTEYFENEKSREKEAEYKAKSEYKEGDEFVPF